MSSYNKNVASGKAIVHKCILALLEKWEQTVDSDQMFGALLTDLSKAFDCLDHELLIAYGFHLPALKLVHDYLLIRKQRTKVNRTYSSWLEIVFSEQYLVHYCLTSSWQICFSYKTMLILRAMQMIILHMLLLITSVV